MKRTMYALAAIMTLLATGCNNTETSIPTTVEEFNPFTTVEAPSYTTKGKPVYTISTNNINSLESGGNFYVTVSWEDYGKAEYDIQYTDDGVYAGTYVYSYLYAGQSIEDFVKEIELPINVEDVSHISDEMYFCFLQDNGLEGFDSTLNQVDAYAKLCEQYGLPVSDTPMGENVFSPDGAGASLLAEPTRYNIPVGENANIMLVHMPEGYTGNYIYDTADPLVATVDINGVITAVKKGSTTVTTSTEDGMYSSQFVITVE